MTPIERAARAVMLHHYERQGIVVDRDLIPAEIAYGESFARAVLQAIREPSEGMVEAAVNKAAEIGPHDHVGVYRAMIDAALAE